MNERIPYNTGKETALNAMTTDFVNAFVETNGIRLHVVLKGPSGGPMAILLHGFPEFWRGWIDQIEPLASAGYRVLVPDQRGYNLSDKPVGVRAYHINNLALDVIGLIDKMGREKAVLIGHDWGAAVAWHVAARCPARLNKLVVLNVPHPAVMANTLRRSPAQLRKSWYMLFFQLPFLPEWLLRRNNWKFACQALTRTSRPGAFTEEDLALYREAWSKPGAMTAMLNWYRSAVRLGIGQVFKPDPMPRISVPTLLIWGANDVALDQSMAQPSVDLCEDGLLVLFEDATHWVQHEKAKQVNKLILDFISERSAG